MLVLSGTTNCSIECAKQHDENGCVIRYRAWLLAQDVRHTTTWWNNWTRIQRTWRAANRKWSIWNSHSVWRMPKLWWASWRSRSLVWSAQEPLGTKPFGIWLKNEFQQVCCGAMYLCEAYPERCRIHTSTCGWNGFCDEYKRGGEGHRCDSECTFKWYRYRQLQRSSPWFSRIVVCKRLYHLAICHKMSATWHYTPKSSHLFYSAFFLFVETISHRRYLR